MKNREILYLTAILITSLTSCTEKAKDNLDNMKPAIYVNYVGNSLENQTLNQNEEYTLDLDLRYYCPSSGNYTFSIGVKLDPEYFSGHSLEHANTANVDVTDTLYTLNYTSVDITPKDRDASISIRITPSSDIDDINKHVHCYLNGKLLLGKEPMSLITDDELIAKLQDTVLAGKKAENVCKKWEQLWMAGLRSKDLTYDNEQYRALYGEDYFQETFADKKLYFFRYESCTWEKFTDADNNTAYALCSLGDQSYYLTHYQSAENNDLINETYTAFDNLTYQTRYYSYNVSGGNVSYILANSYEHSELKKKCENFIGKIIYKKSKYLESYSSLSYADYQEGKELFENETSEDFILSNYQYTMNFGHINEGITYWLADDGWGNGITAHYVSVGEESSSVSDHTILKSDSIRPKIILKNDF